MMLEGWIQEKYRSNYEMACEDGHGDSAGAVAWEWTEDEYMRMFQRVKGQMEAAHLEAVNREFFG